MITEHQEIARYRLDDRLRAAEAHALRKADRATRKADRATRQNTGLAGEVSSPRRELAGALRRLADRLEPRLDARIEARIEAQPRHRRTGLSVVR
ncbi:hypothetical protein EV643_101369 [Kribbella sp. VKM Ac-2527]|uniref:Uncharacterized protein n=1 Tax=Kribbella caucasensis TaxID=2512215 RepID=A0A4V3CB58_9ACTN|nr:hypothetical protein [Kribbella sp. VKM Ac-2527]TDO54580.1 hypothetical protein EV643_101369 [Kribbella sp. VKM Ac-2527]